MSSVTIDRDRSWIHIGPHGSTVQMPPLNRSLLFHPLSLADFTTVPPAPSPKSSGEQAILQLREPVLLIFAALAKPTLKRQPASHTHSLCCSLCCLVSWTSMEKHCMETGSKPSWCPAMLLDPLAPLLRVSMQKVRLAHMLAHLTTFLTGDHFARAALAKLKIRIVQSSLSGSCVGPHGAGPRQPLFAACAQVKHSAKQSESLQPLCRATIHMQRKLTLLDTYGPYTCSGKPSIHIHAAANQEIPTTCRPKFDFAKRRRRLPKNKRALDLIATLPAAFGEFSPSPEPVLPLVWLPLPKELNMLRLKVKKGNQEGPPQKRAPFAGQIYCAKETRNVSSAQLSF